MKRLYALVLAVLVVTADLLSKAAVFDRLEPDQVHWIAEAGKFRFGLTEVRNLGVTGGMFSGVPPWAISLLTSIAVLCIAVYIFRSKTIGRWVTVGLSLILGGAAGNLYDRLIFGFVRDFLDVWPGLPWPSWLVHWPTFNVADAAIVAGVGMLVFHSLFLGAKKGEQAGTPVPAE